jgi:hypothetical protein
MFPHPHCEAFLAINFPNAPADGATYTEGTVQWQYSSSNNAWTMITMGTVGIDNGVNHDQEVVFLDRNVTNQNIPTAGVGLTYNPTTRKLGIKANVSQANNLFELTNSSDVVLSAFNARGILNKAGQVYYQNTSPTVDAADTGQLWYHTGANTLNIWNGSAWVSAGGGVDIASNQIITGAKTFSTNVTLGSSASLIGESSLVFKPTNTTALTLTTTTATFAVPVNFSAVGADVKNAVVTKADNMTVDGVKTFSGTINAASGILMNSGSGTSRIFSSSTTLPKISTNHLVIQPTQSTSGRYIQLYSNSTSSALEGITIRAKNENNEGDLNVIGNTKITGNLEITGSFTLPTTFTTIGATSIGSFKSQNGDGDGNINTVPVNIGPLTFSHTLQTTTWLPTTTVTNTSTTPVSFYYKREQIKNNGTDPGIVTYGIHKFRLNASSSVVIPITNLNTMPVGSYVRTTVAGYTEAIVLAGQTNAPVITSFIICPG